MEAEGDSILGVGLDAEPADEEESGDELEALGGELPGSEVADLSEPETRALAVGKPGAAG